MIDELITFQKRALALLRSHCAAAHNEYRSSRQNQVVSFTAPTGAGKTIIMASLIEDILFGTEQYIEQPEAIFVWLSDSPELNQQSKEKIDTKADKIQLNQCVIVSDDSFDREMLDDGHIYFLNTQKLSRTSNLTQHSDNRQYTIWETLANTISEKSERLYFIIDEAHRGMRGSEAGKATSIMQKFILGSTPDGMPPAPVVIGMSATIERFNQLVKNSTATNRPVRVLPEDVRSSGLLKDRVIIYYPKDANEQKDMAVLQAAADEWLQKCLHWETFCREQHHWMVKPVFVVQVLNGNKINLTETDLDESLKKIEERTGCKFEKGEVVHAFGETKNEIVINGLEVPYVEPSKIQDDKRIKVVFFKETLSTGWDCPRAETMMSFRRYVDATAIAQLLGRMVRTPIHQRVLVDDMLNDVQLFLPHFDATSVNKVIEELQGEEGGELPTDVIGDEIEHGTYVWYSAHQPLRRKQKVDEAPSLFDRIERPDERHPSSSTKAQQHTAHHLHSSVASPKENNDEVQEEMILEDMELDRQKIIDFINSLAMPSYHLRQYQQNDYLTSLFALSRFLVISGLKTNAREEIIEKIVEMIHNYILGLKSTGRYAAGKEKVQNFEMLANIYDAFGEQLKSAPVRNIFSETNQDLELQLRAADKKIGNEGVAYAYGKKYDNPNAVGSYMVDVILFVCDKEQMESLLMYAKKEYYQLNDKYRQKTIGLSDKLRTQYRNITRESAEVTNTPFSMGNNTLFKENPDGEEYDDHLLLNNKTGMARIKLNGWEKDVIEAERERKDFRCWYRNPSRGSEALTLYHDYKGKKHPFYPDFLIIRRKDGENFVIDILEPHDPTRDDNVSKAKSLAQYASDNPYIGRVQLIRIKNTSIGKVIRRLDFAAHSELREKVSVINTNDELDNLFEQYGE